MNKMRLILALSLEPHPGVLDGLGDPELHRSFGLDLGLRPMRAARCAFTSLPRPGIVNSPSFRLSRGGLEQQVEEAGHLPGWDFHLLGQCIGWPALWSSWLQAVWGHARLGRCCGRADNLVGCCPFIAVFRCHSISLPLCFSPATQIVAS